MPIQSPSGAITVSDDDFDLDELMRRIRLEVERRRAATGIASVTDALRSQNLIDGAASPALELSRCVTTGIPFEAKDRYGVSDFLRYFDEEFVRNVYVGILRRQPDGAGLATFLGRLRDGDTSRIEVLARVRYSPEGRAAHVPVAGLRRGAALAYLQRIPVLGAVVAMIQALVRPPGWPAIHLEQIESGYLRRDLELRRGVDANSALIEQSVNAVIREFSGRMEQLKDDQVRLERKLAAIDVALRDVHSIVQANHLEVSRKAGASELTSLAQRVGMKANESDVMALSARLSALADTAAPRADVAKLEEAFKRRLELAEGIANTHHASMAQSVETKADATDLTSLSDRLSVLADTAAPRTDIAKLEEAFKRRIALTEGIVSAHLAALERRLIAAPGRTADVRYDEGHVAPPGMGAAFDAFYRRYEDTFRGSREDIANRVLVYLPAVASAGTLDRPVLDIGCGRGEWLEVLRDRGFAARGVDVSGFMVGECAARGLAVSEDDALVHLQALPSSSLGAITAMHLVEHVPFSELLALVEEAHRVLDHGGVLIMETPNPENVLVGANTFYLDPTHRHPIPPPLLAYVASYVGFVDVETLRLHPRAEAERLTALEATDRERLNALLFGPQDYAVIARKAAGEAPKLS